MRRDSREEVCTQPTVKWMPYHCCFCFLFLEIVQYSTLHGLLQTAYTECVCMLSTILAISHIRLCYGNSLDALYVFTEKSTKSFTTFT